MRHLSSINRFLLPGLAFQATVIGGGYATGCELIEFFMPSGPMGGLYGMALAMVIWSVICAVIAELDDPAGGRAGLSSADRSQLFPVPGDHES